MSDFVYTHLTIPHRPALMGIVNVTPDSFSDGGELCHTDAIHHYINDLWNMGVQIIDIGAESTRPNAKKIDAATEIKRLSTLKLPLKKELSYCYYSIDTYKAETAEFALKNGFDIVNDITGLNNNNSSDNRMARLIADYNAGVVIMYNHALNHHKTGNIITDCLNGLKKSLDIADYCNINPNKICLDIGIGFGITPQETIILVNNLVKIKQLGFPILVGASRKSFMNHFLNIPDIHQRLGATLATHLQAVQNGADIIRIHDVFEHKQFFNMKHIFNSVTQISDLQNA